MSFLPDLGDLPRERTLANARRWAAAYLGHVLDVPPEQVDFSQAVAALGLDSVDAVVMAGAMEEHFQTEIDATLYLDEGTLEEALVRLGDDAAWS
jgi:acyl carrier protein